MIWIKLRKKDKPSSFQRASVDEISKEFFSKANENNNAEETSTPTITI
jgi:hypothetical protein